jgi:serine/threonine protein kinase HipA of HipAB toxin-antitoxin module
MTHVRAQIVAAVAAALTGLATTGSRVFVQRRYPADETALPCLLIYRGGEVSEVAEMGTSDREMSRVADILVEAVAAGETADDTLDRIAAEAEAALAADIRLGGLARDTHCASWQPGPTGEDQGRKRLASARLTVRVTYFTLDTDPETAV